MYYQIFKELPVDEDIKLVVEQFGIDFESLFGFIQLQDITNKMTKLKPIFKKYYISCKYRLFVEDGLNEKHCITILRHFLKVKGYVLKLHCNGLHYIAKKKVEIPEPTSLIIRFD